MQDGSLTVYGLQFCLALSALYVLNYCWRTYRIDVFRQFVFDIRDGLFDIAADREWFEKPAYLLLRAHLNASIRYAHKTSLLHVLLLNQAVVARPAQFQKPRSPWDELIAQADGDEIRSRLIALRHEFNQLLIERIMSFGPLFVVLKLSRLYRRFRHAVINVVEIEARAYEVESVEHRRPATTDRLTA
jgi:hypothetical protein